MSQSDLSAAIERAQQVFPDPADIQAALEAARTQAAADTEQLGAPGSHEGAEYFDQFAIYQTAQYLAELAMQQQAMAAGVTVKR